MNDLHKLIESIIEEEVEQLDEFTSLAGGNVVGYILPVGQKPKYDPLWGKDTDKKVKTKSEKLKYAEPTQG